MMGLNYQPSDCARACFTNFISSKVSKQIAGLRVQARQKKECNKALLPLSFGLSSLTLLHLLDTHIKRQIEKAHRQAYEVHVLHVDESCLDADRDSAILLAQVKLAYPAHSYHICRSEDIFKEGGDLDDGSAGFFQDQSRAAHHLQPAIRLKSWLASLPSASSVEDVLVIVRNHLVTSWAKALGCETILWGSSTTRLAEKTLAETAKGRGFSLPWSVNEVVFPHNIAVLYPLRDVLRKEIMLLVELSGSIIQGLVRKDHALSKRLVSSKHATIHELMARYFESVEDSYPSIVTNVVKTSSKLQIGTGSTALKPCKLCGFLIPEDARGIGTWEGNQDELNDEAFERIPELCYGCCRSLEGSKESHCAV